MTDNTPYLLIHKYITGAELSDNDLKSAQHHPDTPVLRHIWELSGQTGFLSPYESQRIKKEILRHTENQPGSTAWNEPPYRRAYLMAAAFSLSLLILLVSWMIFKNAPVSTKYMYANQSQPFYLEDGTELQLRENSTFAFEISPQERKAHLTGEALLHIHPDPEKPFFLHAGNMSIRVTGTSFLVKAFPQDSMYQVYLISGNVQVIMPSDTISLMPGEMISFNKYTLSTCLTEEIEPNLLAWATHILTFDQTPLPQVFNTLENVYHTRIKAEEGFRSTAGFTGSFQHARLEEILEIMSFSLKFQYHVNYDEHGLYYRISSR